MTPFVDVREIKIITAEVLYMLKNKIDFQLIYADGLAKLHIHCSAEDKQMLDDYINSLPEDMLSAPTPGATA